MHRAHDGLPERKDHIRATDHPPEEVLAARVLAGEHRLGHLEVAARAERPSGSPDDDDARGLVGTRRPQRGRELLVRLHAEGVELLRAVEGDRRDAVARLVVDVLVHHASGSPNTSVRAA